MTTTNPSPISADESPRKERRSRGAILADARAAKGLSVAEVAEQLKLTRRVVEAIENDDVDELPPLIFTRGYLRSYCKLLGLDESRVMEPYEEVAKPASHLSDHQPGMMAAERKDRHSKPWLWILLILLLLAGGVAAVYFLGQSDDRYDLGSSFDDDEESDEDLLTEDEAELDLSLGAVPPPMNNVSAGSNSAPPPMGEASGVSNSDDIPEPTAPAEVNAAADENNGAAANLDDTFEQVTITAGSVDSHVTIYNRSNRIVHTDLFRNGKTYTFDRAGRYRLFVGVANSVTVTLDGKEYDYSGDARNGSASFFFTLK